MSSRSLFLLGLGIPLLTGGNWFLFVTPAAGLLVFDILTIVSASRAEDRSTSEAATGPASRIALASALVLGLWWGATLLLRPSGPRAALEAQGIFCGILLFALLSRAPVGDGGVRCFARGLLVGAFATAVYGQYQYWYAFSQTAPELRTSGIPFVQYVNANFYNANCYGAFLAAAILLGAGLVVTATDAPSRGLAILATACLGGTLLLSESRAAVTLLLLGSATWYANSRWPALKSARALRLVSLVVFLAFAGVAAAVDVRELWKVGLLGRVAIWQGSLRMIRDHWLLGVGLGRFWDYFPQYQVTAYYTRYPHSFLIEVFSELGIVGVVALLAFLAAAATTPLRRLTAGTSTAVAQSAMGAALVLGAAVLTLHGLVDIDWHAPANPILLFVLLGLAQHEPEPAR